MYLLVEHIITLPTETINILKRSERMKSQALFIQALFENLSRES